MRTFSKREKTLLGLAGSVLIVFLIVIVSGSGGDSDAGTGVIGDARLELAATQALADLYAPLRAKLLEAEGKINRATNVSLLSSLESIASPLGIQIDEAINRSKPDNQYYKEEAVEITLRGINQQQLAEFLLAMRESEVLLSAKTATIKRRARDATLLDVTLEVSTFKPL